MPNLCHFIGQCLCREAVVHYKKTISECTPGKPSKICLTIPVSNPHVPVKQKCSKSYEFD